MIIPYKVVNIPFMTLYGIITGSCPPSFRERNLIVFVTTHTSQGTSYGYIHFGTKESAEAATMVLNNCKICGNIVKLSVQEEGNNNENKRSRLSYDGNTQRQWN